MKSHLFAENLRENTTNAQWVAQNTHMLRVHLEQGREVVAWKGSMVAYQGDIRFDHQGSKSVSHFFKKMVSGDNVPLMRVSGVGDVFFGAFGANVHMVELEGESITCNGSSLLAFDPALQYDLNLVKGAGMLSGGMWNTTLTGHGMAAIVTRGNPVLLDTGSQPTFTDVDATVAWAGHLAPSVKSSMNFKSSLRGGSGEAFQYAFQGPGWVVVQPFEPPTQPGKSGGGSSLSFGDFV